MSDEPELLELSIPSESAEGQRVQERIVGLLEAREFSPRDVFGVRLALEEALVNAIKHGNDSNPEKSVRIECRVGDREVEIVIEDEGDGFDPEDVPDCTLEENLERPSGRGLMLMRSFMTQIEYNEVGNRVRLHKVCSDDEEEV